MAPIVLPVAMLYFLHSHTAKIGISAHETNAQWEFLLSLTDMVVS